MLLKQTQQWIEQHEKSTIRPQNIPPNIYSFILERTSFLIGNIPIRQRLWHIMHDYYLIPSCSVCDKPVGWNARYKKYRPTCSLKCSSNSVETREKTASTNKIKYGHVCAIHNPIINQTIKDKFVEKYGVDNPLKSKDIRQRIEEKWLTRYGVNNPRKSIEIQNKIKQTFIDRYGTDNPMKSIKIRDRAKDTMVNRYGFESALQIPHIKERYTQTVHSRYGVDNPLQSVIIRDKIKQTNILKYGVDNPFKNALIQQFIKDGNMYKYGVDNINKTHIKEQLNMLTNKDWLAQEYQHKTAKRIAEEINVNETTVLNYLRSHDIEIRHQLTFYSYASIRWLESIMQLENIHIQHALNDGEFLIPGTKYRADGYCQETNTIYEFHGDYWHGNPLLFESSVINEVIGKTMGELYQKTIIKEEEIRGLGYNLVVKWETE